jgi:hypothetical protein
MMGVKNVINAASSLGKTNAAGDIRSRVKKGPERSAEPKKAQVDKKTISPKAKEKSQIATYVDLINKIPDVRESEIARVKSNLEKGVYSSRSVTKKTAEKMIEE